MSYSRNIARLKETSRANLAFSSQQRTEAANREGQAGIDQAKDVATKLSHFSKELGEWRLRDIAEKKKKGKAEARKHAVADAEAIAKLAEELKRTKQEDTRYQEIKQEMLKLGGADVYPDADRIAHLSPWGQVGYAKEKLRAFNETFDDKLAHSMQNSEKAITISGVTFTPKQLRDNNIQGLPFKEAAVKVLSEDIRSASGVDKFSPELQALAGTDEAILKSQEGQMAKYRERYNIDSSHNTRVKAQKEWAGSAKTGEDLHRLFLIQSNTVDAKNNILGNTGGWNSVMGVLESEGIASGDPYYADRMGALELPESLRQQVGAKKGTTFAQQWPGRFAKLKSDIKAGEVKANNAELAYQKTAGTELEAQFIERARKGDLTTDQVNQYKRRFGELGLAIPAGVTNYETVSMRDQREDEGAIKALMASQNGYISNEQLDGFHPLAALEYREKADRLEKAALKEFDAQEKIKGDLNTVFTGMGIKANEKSPAYIEALSNAKQDYARQYNDYIAMGHSPEHASHYALHGKPGEVKDAKGNPIPGRMGVLTEIKQNGANSKYVVTGQSVERSLKPGAIRVARIASGKREMLDDHNIIQKGVIGGDYGHRQITSIKNNLEKHGPRGLRMDKGALAYYEGLARGRNPREGGWWGLVDAQLKASGHEGLNPETVPRAVTVMTGKDKQGNTMPDPFGLVILQRRISNAMKYPSAYNNRYIQNTLKDGYNNNGTSVFDRPENQATYLQ